MPCDYKKYPANWATEIRPRILKRADNKCERCGVPNHVIGYRESDGKFVELAESIVCAGMEVEAASLEGHKVITIVLTIAHIGPNKADTMRCEDDELLALCQRCHNLEDAQDRAKNAAATRLKKRLVAAAEQGQVPLFDLKEYSPQGVIKTAHFSQCRNYRYNLFRIWNDALPYALFICLNPSTADETTDDPTVRRCIQFSRDWGYGGFCMANIFAFRATDPKNMKAQAEPIGPRNDFWLKELATNAGIVVCAWGTHGAHLGRAAEVLRLLRPDVELHHLELSKDGHPKHPLYLRRDLKPIEWKGEAL